jgi:maltose alpha-D-glucosyltransferase/alpha-amylase
MAFHFPLMPRMYMAVAQEDRFPITDIMRQTPDIPENCQWAIFLRNHDELTLEMVTDSERDYLWDTYASDKRARINLGIRRRLAPLMERDRRRIELMNALLLSMPGTPVLYYGDEIGMGDNVYLGDRDGVRTPMQWSMDRNGGFSKADPASLTLPPIMDPLYGYQTINVEAQERDRHSPLNWVKRMLAVRGQHKAFGRGTQRFLRPTNRKILAYVRAYDGDHILCVANLSRTAQAVELDLHDYEGRVPVEMTGGAAFPSIGQLPYLLTLPPYGFLWFTLCEDAAAPEWSSGGPGAEIERYTFVLRPELADVALGANRGVLEGDILPPYVAQRRWFGAKDETIRATRLAWSAELPGARDLLLAAIEVETDGTTARYALPLGIVWEGEQPGRFAPALALARVRRGRNVGLLTDGFAVEAFARSVVHAMTEGATFPVGEGACLRFSSFPGFDVDPDIAPDWLSAEQSNSTLVLGDSAVVKLLRKIAPGIHPEIEMVRHLTENGFESVPPMLGLATLEEGGERSVMMLAQAYVHNQGDGWEWTLGVLERLATDTEATFANYENFAARLGQRLAEMHAVLARPTDDPAFAPETMTRADAEALGARVEAQLDRALGQIEAAGLDDEDARFLLDHRTAIAAHVRTAAGGAEGEARTRIHGDLHLGQMLVTGGDVMLIDFEGEPAKPLDERRAKDLPARDVAGVLRSFDYAAAVALAQRPASADTEEARTDERYAEFRTRAARTFLAGYTGEETPEVDALTGLYLIEKAAYEIGYEAANRPDWLGVPVAGLARVARLLMGEAGA